MYRKYILICCFIAGAILSITAQYQSKLFQQQLNKFATNKEFREAGIGLAIHEIATGKILASYNANQNLVPASSIKVLTTGVALDKLGEDFTYQTRFYLIGNAIQDSIWQGDILIQGEADPSLGFTEIPGAKDVTEICAGVVYELKKRNIKGITGSIKWDARFIKDIPENVEWQFYDLGNYYGTGVHAINIFENAYTIGLEKQKDDSLFYVSSISPIDNTDVQLSCAVTCRLDLPYEEPYVIGYSNTCNYTIHGNMPTKSTKEIKGAIPNPAFLFAKIVEKHLIKHQISISPTVDQKLEQYTPQDKLQLIYVHHSPILKNLALRPLRKSVNLYCESFVHQLAQQTYQSSERIKGLFVLHETLKSYGLESRELSLVDGSGLSAKNVCSAGNLSLGLQRLYTTRKLRYLPDLLVDPTMEGWLKELMKQHPQLKGKLRIKTGSLQGVKTLAGYIMHENKPVYSFSVLLNKYACNSDYVKQAFVQLFVDLIGKSKK